jgi:hypothetical protein
MDPRDCLKAVGKESVPAIEPSNSQPVATPAELSRLVFEQGKGRHEKKGQQEKKKKYVEETKRRI